MKLISGPTNPAVTDPWWLSFGVLTCRNCGGRFQPETIADLNVMSRNHVGVVCPYCAFMTHLHKPADPKPASHA